MKRKFQHYVITTFLVSLASLAISGILMISYHLMFNSPTITFGGW